MFVLQTRYSLFGCAAVHPATERLWVLKPDLRRRRSKSSFHGQCQSFRVFVSLCPNSPGFRIRSAAKSRAALAPSQIRTLGRTLDRQRRDTVVADVGSTHRSVRDRHDGSMLGVVASVSQRWNCSKRLGRGSGECPGSKAERFLHFVALLVVAEQPPAAAVGAAAVGAAACHWLDLTEEFWKKKTDRRIDLLPWQQQPEPRPVVGHDDRFLPTLVR